MCQNHSPPKAPRRINDHADLHFRFDCLWGKFEVPGNNFGLGQVLSKKVWLRLFEIRLQLLLTIQQRKNFPTWSIPIVLDSLSNYCGGWWNRIKFFSLIICPQNKWPIWMWFTTFEAATLVSILQLADFIPWLFLYALHSTHSLYQSPETVLFQVRVPNRLIVMCIANWSCAVSNRHWIVEKWFGIWSNFRRAEEWLSSFVLSFIRLRYLFAQFFPSELA